MSTASIATHPSPAYELCFHSLYREGHRLAFPCDPEGQVNMDALSSRALNNYLYARTVIGREFAWPSVESADLPAERDGRSRLRAARPTPGTSYAPHGVHQRAPWR